MPAIVGVVQVPDMLRVLLLFSISVVLFKLTANSNAKTFAGAG